MQKIRSFSLPLLLFLLGLALRLALISKGPYHPDCLKLALTAQEILNTGQIHYLQGSGLPLTAILGAFFVLVANYFKIHDPVLAVNLMSVLLGSLCIPVFFLLVEKFFDRTAAILSTILLITNPLLLALSTYGNSHIPSLLFLLLGLLLFKSYFSTYASVYFISGCLCFGFMGGARLQEFIVMVIPVAFLFFIKYPRRGEDNKTIIYKNWPYQHVCLFLTITFFIILIFYLPSLKLSDIVQSSPISFDTFKYQILESYLGPFSKGLSISLYFLFIILSPIGYLLSSAGLWYLFKRKPSLFVFFFLWFIIPFIFFGNLAYLSPRLLTLCVIPLIISLGYFFSLLINRNNLLSKVMYLIFITIIILNLKSIVPLLSFRHKNAFITDYYQWIATKTEPSATIIDRDHSLFVMHYSQRIPLTPPVTLYSVESYELKQFKQKLDNLIDQGFPVYTTDSGVNGYDPKFKIADFFLQNYDFEYVGEKIIEEWYYGSLHAKFTSLDLFKVSKPQ